MRLLAVLMVLAALAPAKVVSQATGHGRVVALTFDAGADKGYAADILTILERNRIHASFGMTGKWAEQNPALVKRMARDGDTLINHTYDHRSFTGFSTSTAPLPEKTRVWEITQTDRVVRRLTGHSTKPYWRPPFGDYDRATPPLLARLGYTYAVMWTVDSLGWDHLPAAQIVTRCLSRAAPGTIYLMHVGIQSQDALALQQVIDGLRRRGYRFETIAQLFPAR